MARLERDGVILLRDLDIMSSGQFATVAAALFGDQLLSYSNRSTPRTELKGRIGDGEALEDEVLETVRTIYDEEKVAFEWKSGDLILLDNLLYSHGRDPYEGMRKVLVAMAEAPTWAD